MRAVYVCHPYASDPQGNTEIVRNLCLDLSGIYEDVLFVAPHVAFSFLEEKKTCTREKAMRMCIDLLDRCDALLLCTSEITSGMAEEIDYSIDNGIPIIEVSDLG